MEDTKKIVSGVGVPDGDGGSIEREDKKDNLTTENNSTDDRIVEEESEEINPLEDEGDWAENPDTETANTSSRNNMGKDLKNRRSDESIDGALNNPGVIISEANNYSMLKYFNIEFK